jgi:hypothetical protein
MQPGSEWRYGIAKAIYLVYAENPKVAAIFLGGSTARGHADRYSDIELGIFWHQPPTDEERQKAADNFPGDLVYLYPYNEAEEVWSDDFMVGRSQTDIPKSGVLVEIAHTTVDFLDRTFDAVLVDHDPDYLKQNFIAGVLDGIPLYNEALIQEWKQRAAKYPDELLMNVLRRYAQIDHFWRWEMWLDRGNNLMMLYQSWAEIQQKLLHVLLALNRVYYFGFKWLDVVAARLDKKPPDLVKRFAQVYAVEPAEGAGILATLVEETYDIIDAQFPHLDVDWLRSVFRYKRPFWDEAPPA